MSTGPSPPEPLPIGLCAQAACLLEVTARKPGNVHRFRDFDDTHYLDFLLSAAAIGPAMEAAPHRRVSETVLAAVRATRQVTRTNTNLGIVLLLAPLAAVPRAEALRAGARRVLEGLDREDAHLVYEAIRLAAPGGLGSAAEQDVRGEPTVSLREAMTLAADRDLVARQYANEFHEVFDDGVSALRRFGLVGRISNPSGVPGTDWKSVRRSAAETAIIGCHLHLMATHPDTLIARKRGPAEAAESAQRARAVLEAGWPDTPADEALAQLDAWLSAPGRGRNPGTTADLVTASLFVALREGIMNLPHDFASSPGGEPP